MIGKIEKVLKASGSDLSKLVKVNSKRAHRNDGTRLLRNVSDTLRLMRANTLARAATVYLLDMKDFAAVNEVYQEMIPSPKPARTCIQAAQLPRGAICEMEAVATA